MVFQLGNKLSLGLKRSAETRRRIREAKKGKHVGLGNPMSGKQHSKETKRKMSLAKKGKPSHWKGKKRPSPSKEVRRKMSESHKGEKCNFWKGGVTKKNHEIRNNVEYKIWRQSVFTRDNYTCVWCQEKEKVSGQLNADHIKPFALFPKLRFVLKNGRTLCKSCHEKTDTYAKNFISKKLKNY